MNAEEAILEWMAKHGTTIKGDYMIGEEIGETYTVVILHRFANFLNSLLEGVIIQEGNNDDMV